MRWFARQIGRPEPATLGAPVQLAPEANGPFVRCRDMPSTVVRRFTYDPRSETLDVEFVSGRRYRYSGVPAAVADSFAGAFSKGRFFNSHIRDNFRCRELDAEPAADSWTL